jgi:hypothetical protein
MPKYPLTDLNQGMNRHQAPEALPPQFLSNAIGVDIFKPGVLKPLPGGRKLSSAIAGVNWMETAWTGGVFTIYYSTSSGLYRHTNVENGSGAGTLIESNITGQFSVAVLNNVAYIASSIRRLRDDGTTVSRWGITKPLNKPTLSLVAQSTYVIDDCEALTDWSVSSGTLSLSTIAMQGSRSISMVAGTSVTTVIFSTNNITGYHNGTASSSDLVDTSANFYALGVSVGISTVTNMTDTSTSTAGYSQMLVTTIASGSSVGDTLVGTLAGGENNCWNVNDQYLFTGISTATGTSTVGDGSRLIAVKTGSWDLMHFGSGGSASDEQDYIELNIRYSNIRDLTQIVISFDCNDGTFSADGYYYLIPLESVSASVLTIKPAESGLFPARWKAVTPNANLKTSSRYNDAAVLGYTSPTYDTNDGATFSPFTQAAESSGYPYVRIPPGVPQRSVVADNDRWIRYRIHKSEFVRYGDTDGADWSTIRGISIASQAAPGKSAGIYVDYIHLRGGGKHNGQYYGMYAFAAADSEGNTIRLSGCSDISAIAEPDQQKILWTVETSIDPQVNQRVLFITGGLLSDWYCAGKIDDNTSTTAQTSIADWEYQDIIENYYPEMVNDQGIQIRDPRDINVPQAFTKVVNYQERIFGFGVAGQENYIWSSSRMRGDDCPELASIVATHKGEVIVNAIPTTNYLHLRGDIKERRLVLGDPGDFSTVALTPIEGDYAAVGPRDAGVSFGAQVVGISGNDIVISDGVSSRPLSEGLLDLVTETGVEDSSVTSLGRYLFISLPTTDGDRTIMVDFINGVKPVYIWDRMFTCLSANVATKRLYGLYDGDIWELLGCYGWREADDTLIEGTTFQIDTANLGIADFFTTEAVRMHYLGEPTVNIYMDDSLINSHALTSVTTKTEKRMGAGKNAAGRYLKLDITGTSEAENYPSIYLPILIFHAPGEDG